MTIKSIFLDTNIVLDIVDDVRANNQKSNQLIECLTRLNCKIFISEDMFSTIYYIVKSKQTICVSLLKITHEWQVVPFGKPLIKQALSLCIADKKLDLEDTLQCLCAKQNQCDFLISSDNTFTNCGIKVVNYDEFNQIIEQSK